MKFRMTYSDKMDTKETSEPKAKRLKNDEDSEDNDDLNHSKGTITNHRDSNRDWNIAAFKGIKYVLRNVPQLYK